MENQFKKSEFATSHFVFLSPRRPCESISDVLEFDASRDKKVVEALEEMKKEGYTQFNIQYIPSLEISGKGLLHVIIIAWK